MGKNRGYTLISKACEYGYTLIEILIVVAILGLLMIASFYTLRYQLGKARDARRKSDVNLIKEAVEEYEKDNDCYPPVELVICSPGIGLKPYLNKIPCDPNTGDSYFYEIPNDSCPDWYRIYVKLESPKDKNYLSGIGPSGTYNYYVSSPNAPRPSVAPASSPTPPAGSPPSPPTPIPTPTFGPGDQFWGCKNGECVPLVWDPSIPGPECQPTFSNPTCNNNQCIQPGTECLPEN